MDFFGFSFSKLFFEKNFRFNTKDSDGVVLNENRASCIMPWTEAENWVDFEVSLDGGPFYWKGMFFVEPPNVSPELVWFKDELVHTLGPSMSFPNNLKPQYNFF